jgi:hypothetical protein
VVHATAAVLSYLDLKDELRKKPNNKGLKEQLEPLLEAIIELVPTPDKRTDLLHKLDEQKDKKVCIEHTARSFVHSLYIAAEPCYVALDLIGHFAYTPV